MARISDIRARQRQGIGDSLRGILEAEEARRRGIQGNLGMINQNLGDIAGRHEARRQQAADITSAEKIAQNRLASEEALQTERLGVEEGIARMERDLRKELEESRRKGEEERYGPGGWEAQSDEDYRQFMIDHQLPNDIAVAIAGREYDADMRGDDFARQMYVELGASGVFDKYYVFNTELGKDEMIISEEDMFDALMAGVPSWISSDATKLKDFEIAARQIAQQVGSEGPPQEDGGGADSLVIFEKKDKEPEYDPIKAAEQAHKAYQEEKATGTPIEVQAGVLEDTTPAANVPIGEEVGVEQKAIQTQEDKAQELYNMSYDDLDDTQKFQVLLEIVKAMSGK